MTVEDIYTCIEITIIKCKDYGYSDLAGRFDDALHLGSSGMEILGAIRTILKEEKNRSNEIIGKKQVIKIIDFVESCYGTR